MVANVVFTSPILVSSNKRLDIPSRMPLIIPLPGATSDTPLYAENINDELQHIVADLTAIQERCISLLGLHASLAGNHLAVVSRRLAAVATIFLPIFFFARFWGGGTSTSLPAPSKRDGRRSWSSAWD
jgi:CorA-like Mg2+ transporter protein